MAKQAQPTFEDLEKTQRQMTAAAVHRGNLFALEDLFLTRLRKKVDLCDLDSMKDTAGLLSTYLPDEETMADGGFAEALDAVTAEHLGAIQSGAIPAPLLERLAERARDLGEMGYCKRAFDHLGKRSEAFEQYRDEGFALLRERKIEEGAGRLSAAAALFYESDSKTNPVFQEKGPEVHLDYLYAGKPPFTVEDPIPALVSRSLAFMLDCDPIAAEVQGLDEETRRGLLYHLTQRVDTDLDGIREQYRRACAEISAPASAEDFAAQQAILLGVEESSYQEGLNRLCLAHPICAMAVMIIRIEEKFMIVPVIRDDTGSQTLLDCLLDHSPPDASGSTEETSSSPR